MLSSEMQLELKKDVIVRAYETYSGRYLVFGRMSSSYFDTGLPKYSIPTIEEMVESPLVYGYRTKITPHFERPPKHIKPSDVQSEYPNWLKIGFNVVHRNSTMDIEVSLAWFRMATTNQLYLGMSYRDFGCQRKI